MVNDRTVPGGPSTRTSGMVCRAPSRFAFRLPLACLLLASRLPLAYLRVYTSLHHVCFAKSSFFTSLFSFRVLGTTMEYGHYVGDGRAMRAITYHQTHSSSLAHSLLTLLLSSAASLLPPLLRPIIASRRWFALPGPVLRHKNFACNVVDRRVVLLKMCSQCLRSPQLPPP